MRSPRTLQGRRFWAVDIWMHTLNGKTKHQDLRFSLPCPLGVPQWHLGLKVDSTRSPALSVPGSDKGHPWPAKRDTGGVEAQGGECSGIPGSPTTTARADLQHKEVLLTGGVVVFQLLGVQQHLPVVKEAPVTLRCRHRTPDIGQVVGQAPARGGRPLPPVRKQGDRKGINGPWSQSPQGPGPALPLGDLRQVAVFRNCP